MKGFQYELARSLLGAGTDRRKVAFAFLERTAQMLDLDSRELAHRLEAGLDTAIARAEPALIAPANTSLNSESINRDLTEVMRELEQRVTRDFGRPHWYDAKRDIIG